jgi:hypothetical protein
MPVGPVISKLKVSSTYAVGRAAAITRDLSFGAKLCRHLQYRHLEAVLPSAIAEPFSSWIVRFFLRDQHTMNIIDVELL